MVAAAAGVLELDPFDDVPRKRLRATGGTSGWAAAGGLVVHEHEAVELVGGDEPLAPGELDGVDGRNDVAVDGRDAHTQRFRRLATRVGESLDLRGYSEFGRGNGLLRRGNVAAIDRARLSRSGYPGLLKRALRDEPLGQKLPGHAATLTLGGRFAKPRT